MASCPKCDRALPANGNCLYCGKLGEINTQSRSRGIPWLGPAIKLGLAFGLVGLAYWMIFTTKGRAFTESIKSMVGTSSKEDDGASPWVKPLKKYKDVNEILGNKLTTQVTEEELAGDKSWKMVTIVRRNGSELMQWAFKVNKDTGEVIGQNAEARSLIGK